MDSRCVRVGTDHDEETCRSDQEKEARRGGREEVENRKIPVRGKFTISSHGPFWDGRGRARMDGLTAEGGLRLGGKQAVNVYWG